jgi:hypothetical protein
VIPGHGEVGSRQNLIEFREMLVAIHYKVVALKRSGDSLAAVIAAKPTSQFDAKWGGGFITPELFVGLVYRGV